MVGLILYGEMAKKSELIAGITDQFVLTPISLLWLIGAIIMTVLRDFGYIWQLRVLTDRNLSWMACTEVILLWNFFAAVSPSMVGGAAIAIFMLVKEKLSIGRSTAIIFTTVFLDQVFYTSIPLLTSLFIPQSEIFAPLSGIKSELIGTSMIAAFWAAWGTLVAYVFLLIGALFIAPNWINQILARLLLRPLFRRWRSRGLHLVNDLFTASRDLRNRKSNFWFEVWAATSVAWMGRFFVMNFMLAAFSSTPMGWFDHFLTIGRQAVLAIIMVISPTPGSAGVAELGFSWLLHDLTPTGMGLSLAILWRLLTYYPHLIIGVPIMTRWIKRVYGSDIRQHPIHFD